MCVVVCACVVNPALERQFCWWHSLHLFPSPAWCCCCSQSVGFASASIAIRLVLSRYRLLAQFKSALKDNNNIALHLELCKVYVKLDQPNTALEA